MKKTSSLRIYRNLKSFDTTLRNRWKQQINKKEHLKLEYPNGIPMKILYHSGLFEDEFNRGKYRFDENGEFFVFSPDIDGCLINGNREVPLLWYLLFTGEDNYTISIKNANQNYHSNVEKLNTILTTKVSRPKKANKYFLDQCSTKRLLAFEKFFFQEDENGFVELAYGNFKLSVNHIIADRVEEDKKKLLFPKEIQISLEYLLKEEYSKANSILVEITSIHQELTNNRINHL